MLLHGHGDGLVTGAIAQERADAVADRQGLRRDPADGAVGLTAVLRNGRIIVIGDTLVHE